MNIRVIPGNITQVKSDALITTVDPYGAGGRGVHDTIKDVAGRHFHEQVQYMDPSDGDCIVAYGAGAPKRKDYKFKNVIFVVDEFSQPLRNHVCSALWVALRLGYMKVILPMIPFLKKEESSGLLCGSSMEEQIDELITGIELFIYNAPGILTEIVFVLNKKLEAPSREELKMFRAKVQELVDRCHARGATAITTKYSRGSKSTTLNNKKVSLMMELFNAVYTRYQVMYDQDYPDSVFGTLRRLAEEVHDGNTIEDLEYVKNYLDSIRLR